MAMDFGVPAAARSMQRAVIASVTATRAQLTVLYARVGVRLNAQQQWRKLGVTVMIGQNDVGAERVTVADAGAVGGFALARCRTRVDVVAQSRRAVRRDVRGDRHALQRVQRRGSEAVAVHEDVRATLRGNAAASAAAVTTSDVLPDATTTTIDDPAKSPYPIWQPERPTTRATRSSGTRPFTSRSGTPRAPVARLHDGHRRDSPWRLVGPVLRTDHAPKLPTLPRGTYPRWSRRRSSAPAHACCTTASRIRRAGTPTATFPEPCRHRRDPFTVEGPLQDPGRAGERLTGARAAGLDVRPARAPAARQAAAGGRAGRERLHRGAGRAVRTGWTAR